MLSDPHGAQQNAWGPQKGNKKEAIFSKNEDLWMVFQVLGK
jgi:hypothetical protein